MSWSWHRALNPKMGNLYAYMLFPVKNAEAYAKGELSNPEETWCQAVDDRTLEVTLTEPTPYFLQLMDHYSTFALHRKTLEKFGKATDRFTKWTRAKISSATAPLISRNGNSQAITVEKSKTYWDADKVKLNGVVFYPTKLGQ